MAKINSVFSSDKISHKRLGFAILCFFSLNFLLAQTENVDREQQAFAIQQLFAKALSEQNAALLLRELAQDIGQRPAGSDNYAKAANWAEAKLKAAGLTTQQQAVSVTPWVRERPANATAFHLGKRRALRCIALGNAPGTTERGVKGKVVEVTSLDQVDSLGNSLAGKIVFFNRPFDASKVHTFEGYGGAVDQRVYGPARAAKYGAVAAVVRSMTPALDANPHTGSTVFPEGEKGIPAIAISTLDAERIHQQLQEDTSGVEIFFQSGGKTMPTATDHNVIADWKGSEKPNEYILIGAHLDSWDIGEGAHDDGAGVAHVMEAVNLLKATGYQPRHTIRVVLFANEEKGLDGALAYWKLTDELSLKHLAALESDSGGFVPRAFTVGAAKGKEEAVGALTAAWGALLEPFGISFAKGGGGADISGLAERGATLFGLRTDSQRYFDLHHSELDVFSNVHPRELSLGAAGIASLVMLIDSEMK